MQIDKFLESQLSLSHATLTGYRSDLSGFMGFNNGEPTSESVLSYVSYLRNKGRSEAHIYRVLHALKRYCKWVGTDVFLKVSVPSFEVGEPRETLPETGVVKLVDSCKNPLEKALVAVLYDTALRIGELLKVDAEQVDWETGEMEILRKGRRKRTEKVAVFPSTLNILKEYRTWRGIKKGKLFPYEYWELRDVFLRLLERAGLKFPKGSLFHNLRHSLAVNLRLAKVPLEDISERLGHSSLSTTAKIYARVGAVQLRERLKAPPWGE